MEAVRRGTNTPVFLSSTVLCVAWGLASLLRNRDHWRRAATPPKLDADGRPNNRRMWWALWPFFNLAFITAVIALVDDVRDGKSWTGVVEVMADDRLW